MPLLGVLARDYVGRMRCHFDRFHPSGRKSAPSACEHRVDFEKVSSHVPRLQQTAKASKRFQPGKTTRTKGKRGIHPASKPSGTGCVECLASGGWWLQLRRCAECGVVGCCDSTPAPQDIPLWQVSNRYKTGSTITRRGRSSGDETITTQVAPGIAAGSRTTRQGSSELGGIAQ
jgi:hypothetical protein